MREKINEEVSVVMYYSARHRVAMPRLISWRSWSDRLALWV
jgi:hypothetical protein